MFAIFRESGFSKIIFVINLKIKDRHVIENHMNSLSQNSTRMLEANLLNVLFVGRIKPIHVAINSLRIQIKKMIAVQIPGRFALAGRKTDPADDQRAKKGVGALIKANLVIHRTKQSLGSGNGNLINTFKKSLSLPHLIIQIQRQLSTIADNPFIALTYELFKLHLVGRTPDGLHHLILATALVNDLNTDDATGIFYF